MMKNKDKDKEQINTSRRELLTGMTTAVVVGGVIAGTATMANAADIAKLDETQVKKTKYRETQHILDYYDSL